MTKQTCKNGARLQYCKEKRVSFKACEIYKEKKVASDLQPTHYLFCEVISMSPKSKKHWKKKYSCNEDEVSKELRDHRTTEGWRLAGTA